MCVHEFYSRYKVKHILGRWSLDQIWTWNDRTESQWLRHSLILGYCSTILETLSTTTTTTELAFGDIWSKLLSELSYWVAKQGKGCCSLSQMKKYRRLLACWSNYNLCSNGPCHVLQIRPVHFHMSAKNEMGSHDQNRRWHRPASLALFTAEWFINLNFENIDFTRHISTFSLKQWCFLKNYVIHIPTW